MINSKQMIAVWLALTVNPHSDVGSQIVGPGMALAVSITKSITLLKRLFCGLLIHIRASERWCLSATRPIMRLGPG
jgi:hypothetical protein